MCLTTTATSFICLSLGLAVYGWRFSKVFPREGDSTEGNKIGFLISSYFFSSAFQNGVLGFGILFFATHPLGLSVVVILGTPLLIFVAIFGIYVTYYLFWPRKSYLAVLMREHIFMIWE